jgi:hypothetical protein
MNKTVPFVLAAALLAIAAFTPQGGTGALAANNAALAKAPAIRLVLSVQPIPGVASEHKLVLAKPSTARWDAPGTQTATDGKTLWTVDTAKNEYTEEPAPEGETAKLMSNDLLWAWGGFFGSDPFKGATNVQTGAKRTIKGIAVTEITFTTAAPDSRPVTAYLDAKTGLVRGFSIKTAGSETLVIATQLEVLSSAESVGAFAPPAGATKVEKPAASALTFADVSPILTKRCLPCHSAQSRAGRVDVTNYQALVASGRGRNIVPGKPDESRLVLLIRGTMQPRMPQGGPPMPDDEVQKIADWIAGGAKE